MHISMLKRDIYLFLMCWQRNFSTINCVKKHPASAEDASKRLERSIREACFEEIRTYIEEKVLKNGEFMRIFYL